MKQVSKSIGSFDSSSDYDDRRISMLTFVHEVLRSCGLGTDVVRGSWRHNDFHLACSQDQSFSDLDLVVTYLDTKHLTILRQHIERRLQPRLRMKVSIHPIDSMDGMMVEDARLLLIGEYLISRLRKVPEGLMTIDYLRAKITLLFLREYREERYVEVARRVATVPVWSAVQVKLGSAESFSVADVIQCLAGQDDNGTTRFLNGCLDQRPNVIFMNDWKRDVQNAASIESWLKGFLIDRVEQALGI